MKTTSFLHAASAKIIADKLCNDQETISTDADKRRSNEKSRDALAGALRLLLVEEENGTNDSVGIGSLTRSLVMDAAYSLVSGSLLPCRGCCDDVDIDANGNDDCPPRHAATTKPMACRCCRVVLLIPGEVEKTKKKRRRNNNGSKFLGDTRKVAFPISCVRDGINDGEKWDPTLLGQIQIKYVNSLADVIRYLAYAPSLPEHLQPLDGIFLLGLGELLTRQNNNVMEFTHILSTLSDTTNVLEDKRRELLKSDTNAQSVMHARIAVIATIDNFIYSSIPQTVIRYLHQWMDFIASIGTAHSDAATSFGEGTTTSHSEWDLVFTNTGILEPLPKVSGKRTEQETSFRFKVNLCVNESGEHSRGSTHEIAWRV
eukprot:CAMPEP_0201868278 /NCGR_PEP_ID=MMETSP0902-20130614/2235_1 /ASSEMBLY_ACC=CAM_ASM_000551 /TAXON_ID=420261 /ORGANISM="Thalassiosira antarctica, Strain CCMP982" /LENGTH=371 /DNA_ID=CAMNT_0048393605 /DNA_START=45 /DNA_END=1160 /DNA_ORIENTATION=+